MATDGLRSFTITVRWQGDTGRECSKSWVRVAASSEAPLAEAKAFAQSQARLGRQLLGYGVTG